MAAAGPVDHGELVRNSEELFSLALNYIPVPQQASVSSPAVLFRGVLRQGHFRSGDGKRKEDWALQNPENEKRRLSPNAGEASFLWSRVAVQISRGWIVTVYTSFQVPWRKGVKDLHPCTLQEGSLAHFAVGYEGGCALSTGLMQMVMFSHVLSVSHVDC